MKMKTAMQTLAAATVTLFSALAFAAPASAANVPSYKQCSYSYYGQRCGYRAPKPAETPKSQSAPAASTSGLTAAEQQMLDLVNGERAKAGLAPLKADLELTKLARMKSQDMIENSYFSHQSPTYGSPFDMLKRYGVSYRTAGENIAGNRSVEAAHTALMNSPGHRANILNGQFTHVGIGIVDGGSYGKMFTQMFVGR